MSKTEWTIPKEITGIKTGINTYDRYFGGLLPGELTIIAGRSFRGFNEVAFNIGMNVALNEKKSVAYFDIVRGMAFTEKLVLTYLTEINFFDLFEFNYTEEDWDKFRHAADIIKEMDFNPYGTVDLECIIEECEELAQNDNLDLIIIDCLQMIEKNYKKIDKNPEEVLRDLKGLSKRLNVPIIVVSALPTDIIKRKDRHPTLDDLQKMGIFEECWDNAILLYRKEIREIDCLYEFERVEYLATKAFTQSYIQSYIFLDRYTDKLKNDEPLYESESLEKKIFIIDEEDEEKAELEEEYTKGLTGSLEKGLYRNAYKYAKELRKINYYTYADLIEESYKRYALEGNIETLLYVEDNFKRAGEVCDEEFEYLKLLVDSGYTMGFGRIGDCYYYGIGTEKNIKKALSSYISGYIYWEDEHCDEMLNNYYKKEDEWSGYSKLITDLFLYDWMEREQAIIRLADEIFAGKIKEYSSEVAYYIYKRHYLSLNHTFEDDSKYSIDPCIKLAQCLLYGIGTTEKPNVALSILLETYNNCEFELNSGYEDSQERLNEITSLIEEIKRKYGNISSDYSDEEFDFFNDEDMFLNWSIDLFEDDDIEEDIF